MLDAGTHPSVAPPADLREPARSPADLDRRTLGDRAVLRARQRAPVLVEEPDLGDHHDAGAGS